MTNIKIDKRYKEPWEIMKAASEGKRWAWFAHDDEEPRWVESTENTLEELAGCIAELYTIGVIDDSKPESIFEDEKWDWEFFHQYGGIRVMSLKPWRMTHPENGTPFRNETLDDVTLRPSPFYYWRGGEQPVPDDVEVTVQYRDKRTDTGMWQQVDDGLSDIIAFKLTGRVL